MGIADIVTYEALEDAFKLLFEKPDIAATISSEHIADTPRRIAKVYEFLYSGCSQDPREVLKKTFNDQKYDEMVYVNDIQFVSTCAHHGLVFFGKAHFAYLPDGKIVGLSKIPRLIEIFARRPQVQEKLTVEIVETFMEEVKPKGCGLVMEGIHLCMAIRGVENESAYTKTTAIRGCFKEPTVKSEFLDGILK